MDVQCERCRTEYEFDDALVSGRGTTVRCTNCGHQFRVRRPDAGPSTVDCWTVTTSDGEDLSFFSLRELQNAISSERVGRTDVLVHGNASPRALGSIAELAPFFNGRALPSRHSPVQSGNESSPPTSLPKGLPTRAGDRAPIKDKIETLRPPPSAAAVPPPATLVYPKPVGSLPPPTEPIRRPESFSDDDFSPGHRAPFPSTTEGYGPPPRRRVGGWIVALALLLAVAVVGWAAAKPYLVARDVPAATKLDPRALSFLSNGERAMADGDLDAAQENLDKASALAEKDARVVVDQARLAATRADLPWLKLRLLPADAIAEQRATRAQLEVLATRERKAAEDAQAIAPADHSTERAKIDALRLAGELGAARSYVSTVIAHASQPETAYVLAALDLAEPEPLWATVIERLRLAAAGEGNAGRARAALVYALGKSGDADGAQTELAKLEAMSHPHPLVPNLRAFVERTAPKAPIPPAASSAVSRAAPSAISVRAPAVAGAPPAGDFLPGDPRAAMRTAAMAIRKGDFSRARQIYQSIIDRNPNDSEALAGLGDVARLQGDSPGAIAIYRQAIAVNPSYLPALLGAADTEWATGQRAKAIHDYNDIVDRFPEGTYPAYVGQRVSAAESAPTPTVPATPPNSGVAPTPTVPREGP
jgi:predicted Zn finger-like uncharacterized protein